MSTLLRQLLLAAPLLAACAAACPLQAQVTLFSGGYVVPENINVAPASFGVHGGEFFINDQGRASNANTRIYTVSTFGGAPNVFDASPPALAYGALFLPSTGWGSNSGHYLTVGSNNEYNPTGQVYTYDADGNRTTFFTTPFGPSAFFAQVALAPSTFGANAGKLIITDMDNGLVVLDSAASLTTFAGNLGFTPFAISFAPSDFGAFGNMAFTDDIAGGGITSLDADGNIRMFATVNLKTGQSGLRQIAFAPSGFLPGVNEPLMLVSVSGSRIGGGTLGDILAFDPSGNQVASLRSDLGLTKFDPRGMYFLSNGNLLVNDASDPILTLTPSAFAVAVPEPSALAALLTSGVIGAGFVLRRRRRGSTMEACA